MYNFDARIYVSVVCSRYVLVLQVFVQWDCSVGLTFRWAEIFAVPDSAITSQRPAASARRQFRSGPGRTCLNSSPPPAA